MSQQAFERGDWAAVIEAHPLESHDPDEWLRYGVALLLTLSPGADAAQQQQQAALAFVQAEREGASQDAVRSAQAVAMKHSVLEGIKAAGLG